VTLGYFDGFETRGPWVRGLAQAEVDRYLENAKRGEP